MSVCTVVLSLNNMSKPNNVYKNAILVGKW